MQALVPNNFPLLFCDCRYEVNPDLVPRLEEQGLQFVGKDETGGCLQIDWGEPAVDVNPPGMRVVFSGMHMVIMHILPSAISWSVLAFQQ